MDRTAPASATEAELDELVADVFASACPSRQILDNVAGRWGTLALVALTEGAYRFNALRRRVQGVSEKMLSQTLQALERDGLVHRDVQATIPPRVEYSLTPLGERVGAKLRALIDLIEEELPAVSAAQERYDREKRQAAVPATAAHA
jgi:DNA-binding HxlR family transcriptional regulator